MSSCLTKISYLFCNGMWRGFEKEKYLLSVVLVQDVMFICKRTGRKCHSHPVTTQMNFWDSLSDKNMSPTFCCSLSCLINCANINDTYFLEVGQMQCKAMFKYINDITHSLSMRDWIDKSAYNDRLTHLLLITWYTMGYNKDHNWVTSLTSCGLWDKSADPTENYSQTVVMRWYIRSMLVQ